VPFPPGRWVDWWTGESHEGGTVATVAAPLGRIPVFLREGGIVPMLRPTIDAMAPTTVPAEVDSYATTAGVLYARIAAGAAAAFRVFDGGQITAERAAGKLTLGVTEGTEFTFGTLFEVVAVGAAPSSVSADGSPLSPAASLAELEAAATGFFHDPASGGTLFVKVAAGAHAVEATLAE
jgi:alpha-D-xyloside xylohydrolase